MYKDLEKRRLYIIEWKKKNRERINAYQRGWFKKHYKSVPYTEETRKRLSEIKMAEKNPMWRGDKVSYNALHSWIKRRKPKPKLCSLCKKRPAYDLANISGKYKRDLDDWYWICRRCHMVRDGRIKNLRSFYYLSRNGAIAPK
jgi:hypothetical protein